METTRRPGGLNKFRVTDHEECGLVIENEDGMRYVVKVPNRATNPRENYSILESDCDNVSNVLSPGEKIVGFLHTHLDHHPCEPSDGDLDGAELSPGMQHYVFKPSTRELCVYGSAEVRT
jgi:proteasome lid subunit RPN8/RPN11